MRKTRLTPIGQPHARAESLTPDGLESDLIAVDGEGREVPYVSREGRAAINRLHDELGLPHVADVQPGTCEDVEADDVHLED